ncbi:hypothetical protein K490DRAFT_51816 [Saccharata proteae CBS 121410]|uniref:Sm domain-containing protein n=1 Tax=Saccharata proteae CBS 121410 TaxID=1314787 RepID=A0A9P4HMQ9_9PEZI|nr:hypothetical protein K490DRAFT_51816 [Saccharata proteae CBS 121410]
MATEAAKSPASNERAVPWLSQFIGRNLRIHVNDKRMFVGQMKCADRDRNIILALTQEYRPPTESAIKSAITESGNPSVQLPLTSRYVGLVVVPGEYITKIEYEESTFGPGPVPL